MSKKIHPDFNLYYFSLGDNHQNVITFIGDVPNGEHGMQIITPGRIVLLGNIDQELRDMIARYGRPTLNKFTSSTARPAGVFPSNAFVALREHLRL